MCHWCSALLAELSSKLGAGRFASLQYYGNITNSKSDQFPDGLHVITQLVEQYTGIMLTAVHGTAIEYECAAPDQKISRGFRLIVQL